MVANLIACLKQVSQYLKIPISKIAVNEDKIPTCILDGKELTGFVNILCALLQKTSNHMAPEEYVILRQWFEYIFTYASRFDNSQNTNHILQELHCILATKSYLIGNVLTVADVVMFYTLQSLMENLSYLDKEKYLNVSRWYDNMQQVKTVRLSKPLIDFSTISLAVR